MSPYPLYDSEGNIRGSSAIITDITERKHAADEKKKLEEQLFHAQKMESIGRLAGGIAHDFNNILVGIMGYAELLNIKFQDETSSEGKAAKVIFKSAQRAANLTKQLLGFARGGKYNLVNFNVDDTIEDIIKVSDKIFEKKISVKFDFAEDIKIIKADKNQFQQIITNLIINAKDAMPKGGVLSFKTENRYIDEEYSRGFPEFKPGNYVKISITDSGMGIPESIRGNIFEPFFTTKGEGKGTGLGLATVYGIVKNHGGHINFSSKTKQGTTFNIYLPSSGKLEPQIKRKVEIVKGNATILIVDDENFVIKLTENMLKKLGYKVYTAESGKKTVEIYKKKKNDIDLVLLDMIMPDMDGKQTFAELKKIDPDVRVLLSSGYSKNDKAEKIIKEGALGFVQKPYTFQELSEIVSKTLSE